MLTDPCLMESRLLLEAKGNLDRDSFRLALGQLADYRRFLDQHECAILLPAKPSRDLLDLARSQGVAVIWPAGADFDGTLKPW